jgi:hypothetical protein
MTSTGKPEATALDGLTLQLLAWVADRPRTYGEAMEAWRTSCPRLPVWEDALGDRLVLVTGRQGLGMNGALVTITAAGAAKLVAGGLS